MSYNFWNDTPNICCKSETRLFLHTFAWHLIMFSGNQMWLYLEPWYMCPIWLIEGPFLCPCFKILNEIVIQIRWPLMTLVLGWMIVYLLLSTRKWICLLNHEKCFAVSTTAELKLEKDSNKLKLFYRCKIYFHIFMQPTGWYIWCCVSADAQSIDTVLSFIGYNTLYS